MKVTLDRFDALAAKAKSGDQAAEKAFFEEAARLFPADFGTGGHHSHLAAGGDNRFEKALAIIRQNVTTGG